MNKVVIIFLGFIFTGCASVSKVQVPRDCEIIPENKQAVTVVCPHEIKVELK